MHFKVPYNRLQQDLHTGWNGGPGVKGSIVSRFIRLCYSATQQAGIVHNVFVAQQLLQLPPVGNQTSHARGNAYFTGPWLFAWVVLWDCPPEFFDSFWHVT